MADTVAVIDRRGRSSELALSAGLSLMQALRDGGYPIAAICDGSKSCATCHVFIEGAPGLPGADADEDEYDLLADLPDFRADSSRLSCQVPVEALTPGAVVTIAPESL